jgi:hypothetical protein
MPDEADRQIQRSRAQIGQELIFSGLVQSGNLFDALRDHEAFAKKVVGILKKRRPADVHDLLNPRPKKDAYPNVAVTYLYFPLWLARFDPGLIRDLDVNINSYRYQRSKHENDVAMELIKIRGTDSGVALMREIEATRRALLIKPYLFFSLYPTPLFPPKGPNAVTVPAGGRLFPLDPSDATIFFTPHIWGPRGTSGYSGPGTNPDELLFHEIIHSAMQMRGGGALSVDQSDVAVVLSNVYLAEKKQRNLRANHSSFDVLPRPEAFLTKHRRISACCASFEALKRRFLTRLPIFPQTWRGGIPLVNSNSVNQLNVMAARRVADRSPAPER